MFVIEIENAANKLVVGEKNCEIVMNKKEKEEL